MAILDLQILKDKANKKLLLFSCSPDNMLLCYNLLDTEMDVPFFKWKYNDRLLAVCAGYSNSNSILVAAASYDSKIILLPDFFNFKNLLDDEKKKKKKR